MWPKPLRCCRQTRRGVTTRQLVLYAAVMGHANIRITLDQYGHLLPGAEDEAAGLLDAFLARQFSGAEAAQTAVADTPPTRERRRGCAACESAH